MKVDKVILNLDDGSARIYVIKKIVDSKRNINCTSTMPFKLHGEFEHKNDVKQFFKERGFKVNIANIHTFENGIRISKLKKKYVYKI